MLRRLVGSEMCIRDSMHCYSLDWHPTDHVSFTDNAHLRKIAPTSKVQVGKSERFMFRKHCLHS